MPKCSIIIPAYKCEKYLRLSVNSVQSQTFPDIEIIVIDDCSPENLYTIIEPLANADGRIRYFKLDKNSGQWTARNIGVREACSEWIAFADADDIWMPEKLELQFKRQAETGADLISTEARCIDVEGNATGQIYKVPEKISYELLLRGNVITCSSVLVKRDLMLKYPMEQCGAHEDYLCWLRILKGGGQAVGIQQPLTAYRLTPGSHSSNKLKMAVRTWRTLKLVEVPFFKRCWYLGAYVAYGIRKHSKLRTHIV